MPAHVSFPLFSTDTRCNPQLLHTNPTPVYFIQRLFPDNSLRSSLCPLNGEPWRFRVHGQAAGGHRPHHRRLHQAEKSRGAELFRACAHFTGRKRRRSRCTPRGSFITASAAACRATSSASCRKSKTSPSPKPCGWSRRSWASRCPRRATQLPAKPKKPACAGSCSTSTSAPSHSFRNACAVPKAPAPANISPAAVSIRK